MVTTQTNEDCTEDIAPARGHLLFLCGTLWITLLSCVIADESRTTISLQFGAKGTGSGELRFPYGLASDPTTGDIFVCDTGNNRVVRFTSLGKYVSSFGSGGTGQGQFRMPQALALNADGSSLYMVDTGNHRVQQFDLTQTQPTFTRLWGQQGSKNGEFNYPRDICVDSAGTVYILDSGNNRIQRFKLDGTHMMTLATDLGFSNPHGMVLDGQGGILVVDTGNAQIAKIGPSGKIVWRIGGKGSQTGKFRNPKHIVTDSQTDFFVADTDNYRIQRFDSAGRFLEHFGVFQEFFSPQSMTLGTNGKLYVVDSNTHRVQGYDVVSVLSRLLLSASTFSPDGDRLNDTITISFHLNSPATVSVWVLDSTAKMVRTLIDRVQYAAFNNDLSWDGRTDSGTLVPAGVYEIRIRVVGTDGAIYSERSVFVTVVYPVTAPRIRITPPSVTFIVGPT